MGERLHRLPLELRRVPDSYYVCRDYCHLFTLDPSPIHCHRCAVGLFCTHHHRRVPRWLPGSQGLAAEVWARQHGKWCALVLGNAISPDAWVAAAQSSSKARRKAPLAQLCKLGVDQMCKKWATINKSGVPLNQCGSCIETGFDVVTREHTPDANDALVSRKSLAQ